MSSRSSSPLSSVQDLSDPELEFGQPSKSTITTDSDGKPSRSSQEASPPPNKRRKVIDLRDPLPADNPRYAFIVAFQAKFNQVFRGVPNLGPQDIEAGVAETPISDHVESLLCKLLGLALNRQKPVEKGHYGRALEEAVATYIEEAPPEWEGKNPLEGGKTFNQMTVEERVCDFSLPCLDFPLEKGKGCVVKRAPVLIRYLSTIVGDVANAHPLGASALKGGGGHH